MLGFPQRNIAPGSPSNYDRQRGRPTASPLFSLLKCISLFQRRSMRFICFLPQAAVPEWDRLVDPDSARMTVLCLEHREKQRPIDGWRPSGVQNRPFLGVFSATQPHKGNRIIKTYGAGDGNRTHVRSLGSFYTAIVRRPLYLCILIDLWTKVQSLGTQNQS